MHSHTGETFSSEEISLLLPDLQDDHLKWVLVIASNLDLINPSPVYSYSKSKGAFAGITLEGTVIITRSKANEEVYGRNATPRDILSGKISRPAIADPLYRMLDLKFSEFKKSAPVTDSNGTLAEHEPAVETIRNIQRNYKAKKGPPPVAPKPVSKMVALYDFEGQQVGDLGFVEGEIITVTSQKGEWFQGYNSKGEMGTFPGNYVQSY